MSVGYLATTFCGSASAAMGVWWEVVWPLAAGTRDGLAGCNRRSCHVGGLAAQFVARWIEGAGGDTTIAMTLSSRCITR